MPFKFKLFNLTPDNPLMIKVRRFWQSKTREKITETAKKIGKKLFTIFVFIGVWLALGYLIDSHFVEARDWDQKEALFVFVPLFPIIIFAIWKFFLSSGKVTAITLLAITISLFYFTIEEYDYYRYNHKTEEKKIENKEEAKNETNTKWLLRWKKDAAYYGKSSTREKTITTRLIEKTTTKIIIKYRGGKLTGYSYNGRTYKGKWQDDTGWGEWKLTFTTENNARGWINDEGKGKAICSLNKI